MCVDPLLCPWKRTSYCQVHSGSSKRVEHLWEVSPHLQVYGGTHVPRGCGSWVFMSLRACLTFVSLACMPDLSKCCIVMKRGKVNLLDWWLDLAHVNFSVCSLQRLLSSLLSIGPLWDMRELPDHIACRRTIARCWRSYIWRLLPRCCAISIPNKYVQKTRHAALRVTDVFSASQQRSCRRILPQADMCVY